MKELLDTGLAFELTPNPLTCIRRDIISKFSKSYRLCSSCYYKHTLSHMSLCGSTQYLLDPVSQSLIFKIFLSDCSTTCLLNSVGVKPGIFRQTASFGQPPCLFHSSIIGIKNKLTKPTVKILMRRLVRSRLIWISSVCKRVSEFT